VSRSLKLLNYSTEDNNFLKLYTELNHNFQIGDIVYINGGYYDISKFIQMIYQYGTSLNIFTGYLKGLKIIAVDLANNAFTVNVPADQNNIIYPFGTENNKFSDPTDLINLAYNTYLSDDLYKDVYVSTAVMTNGSISKGTINNGVFGTLSTPVNLNKPSNIPSNLTINHIASKNAIATSCVINDLTSGEITQKLKVVEDLTSGIPTNPFNLTSVSVGLNNNGFGYNVFEKFIINSTSQTSTINNGNFDNILAGNISLNKVNILGGKYANDLQNVASIFNSDITVSNSTIKNINYATKLSLANSTIDTFIPIYASSAAYNLNNYEIELYIDYDIVANKKWYTGPGTTYYLSGVNKTTVNDFSFLNTKAFVEIIDVTYTFGDITSAKITIKLQGLFGSWNTFKTNNPIIDFDFSKAKIHEYSNPFKLSIIEADSCTISSVLEDTLLAPPLYYIKGTSIIKEGLFNGIFFENTVSMIGQSYGESIYLETGTQLFNTTLSETDPNSNFNYAYIDIESTLKANIDNSEIISGAIYNSEISNTHINNIGETFLNNCILLDGTKVENNVFWNDVSIQFTADTVVSNVIENNAYLGDRKAPWVTAINGIAPLTNTQNSLNINKTEGFRAINYYNSQEFITVNNTANGIPDYTIKYDIPSLFNVQSPFDDTIQFVIADFGTMPLSGATWLSTTNKPKILFNNLLNQDTDLSTRLSNKLGNIVAGTYTDFPGTTPTSSTDIIRVDDNFVKTKNFFNYKDKARTQNDVAVYIDELLPTPNNFPVKSLNNPDLLFFLKVDTSFGADVDNIYTGSSNGIPNGISKLIFRHGGIFAANAGNATIVPACFIEIERVIKTEKDLADVVQNIEIIDCTYCPTYTGTNSTQAYAYNITRPIVNHPTSFYIKDNNNNDITIDVNATNKFVIDVEYWVTWFYDSSTPSLTNLSNPYLFTGRNGGQRTKHTITITLLSDGQTYYIIDDLGNYLVDNLGNRFVWNS